MLRIFLTDEELAKKFKLNCWRRCTDLLVDKVLLFKWSLLHQKGEWHKDNPDESTFP